MITKRLFYISFVSGMNRVITYKELKAAQSLQFSRTSENHFFLNKKLKNSLSKFDKQSDPMMSIGVVLLVIHDKTDILLFV